MDDDLEITPEELERLVGADADVRIVDIRSPTAFSRGHIPGSENIAFHELPQRVDELEDADHIVTVCPHGQASLQAVRLISSYEGTADVRVESLHGGLEAWQSTLVKSTDGKAKTASGEAKPTDGDANTSDRSPF